MGVKVAATGCLNSSPSSTLASAVSSKRRSFTYASFVCRRSSVFGKTLMRSRSCETLRLSRSQHSIKRIVSANFDSDFPDDKFSKEIHELSLRFQLSNDDETDSSENHDVPETEPRKSENFAGEITNWSGDMIPESIERNANSVDLPFSLRIIQRKKQLEEGFMEAGEFAYCSIKKAFSSMVFIIRELQSYTLQMREILFFEDLQGVLTRVQKEMNASFVWLFQQVFSHTPNLMVYVMILLTNYSVYSMPNNLAIAASPPPATVESVSTIEEQRITNFVSSTVKTFSVNSDVKLASINGGGRKPGTLASGTDGDGVSGRSEVEEWGLWKSVVAEAERIQGVIGDGGLDREIMGRFVSPVTVKMEEEVITEDYVKTDIVYQTGLSKEPDNPLLLANYAQFLYLFLHDHKRAEVYFKKAAEIEPKDAESLSKYASFLWHAKKDLWAAEENFLEAISVDPNNSFYTASYAHFLWSNGAEDTCFPLESPENVNSDECF